MDSESYAREEVILARDDSPQKGELCLKCNARIPRFSYLSIEDEKHLKELIRDGRRVEAMSQLMKLTECSVSWAKIWVLHPNGADSGTPCPYCGKPLRTEEAKQCRHCLTDWHNPQDVKKLGA